MNPQKLTERVQSALQDAQAEATRRGHQAVDVEHLATALLKQDDGLFAQLLQRTGSDRGFLEGSIAKALDRASRVPAPRRASSTSRSVSRACWWAPTSSASG